MDLLFTFRVALESGNASAERACREIFGLWHPPFDRPKYYSKLPSTYHRINDPVHIVKSLLSNYSCTKYERAGRHNSGKKGLR